MQKKDRYGQRNGESKEVRAEKKTVIERSESEAAAAAADRRGGGSH